MSWCVSIRKGDNPLEIHTFDYKHHADEFIRRKTILDFPGKWSKSSSRSQDIYTLDKRRWIDLEPIPYDVHECNGYYEYPDRIIVITLFKKKDDSEWKPY